MFREAVQPTTMLRKAFTDDVWYLVLFVTQVCNMRCKMCFYVDDNPPVLEGQLTLEEIQKTAKTLPNLYQLTLSGGEPILRKDIFEVIKAFADNAGTMRVTLPTNGFLTQRAVEVAERILTELPKVRLTMAISIDGIGDLHDEIRAKPGAFKKLQETWIALKVLKDKHPKSFMSMTVACTLSTMNMHQVDEILDFVEGNMDLSTFGFMLARGITKIPGLGDVDMKEFYSALHKLHQRALKHQSSFERGVATAYLERRMKTLTERRMSDTCKSGKKQIVMDHLGNVYPCEMMQPGMPTELPSGGVDGDKKMGNVREFDFDIPRMLSTKESQKLQKFIENRGCFCSWECAHLNNFSLNPTNYARIMAKTMTAPKMDQ